MQICHNTKNKPWVKEKVAIILPRAEVPRDLDIVPLPPGPFYIKIELFFYSAIFQCILNNILLQLYQYGFPNAERQSNATLLDKKC